MEKMDIFEIRKGRGGGDGDYKQTELNQTDGNPI